jgi:predicted nucleic acid-binding protein
MTERPSALIDTNVILRHLLNDHPVHSGRASALFLSVRQGKMLVFCPDTAIFEALYILTGIAGAPRTAAAPPVAELIASPGIQMENKEAVQDALRFWVDQPALDFADCYHLALTKALGLEAIYTFDRKMDRYPGVARLEP